MEWETRATPHPFLRGIACLALTIATTAALPWALMPGEADWVAMGFPQVVASMLALAGLAALPLGLARLMYAMRSRPAVAPVVLLSTPEVGDHEPELSAEQRSR